MDNVFEQIDYWVNIAQNDLHCFPDDEAKNQTAEIFKNLARQGILKYYILDNNKGLMVYCVTPDFKGGLSLNELFMYIKPEFRGDVRLFKKLINHLEAQSVINNCASVRIASNIGYNDQTVLKILQRWGYSVDVVVKYMR